jgi:hypothetical protein
MSAVAKLIVVPEGGRGPFRYLASVDELKKTGQLTCWIDDHEIKMSLQRRQIKERNDENENRAAFMRIYVA